MNNITIDIDNLSESDRSAAKLLAEKAVEPKVWKPKIGKPYFYVDDTGNICEKVWVSNYADCIRYELGNCYPTYEKAEFAFEKLKVTTELERFAEEHNDKEIDWKNGRQSKHFLYYDFPQKTIATEHYFCTKENKVYFTSYGIARQAVGAIGEDRLKKYYFNVQDD